MNPVFDMNPVFEIRLTVRRSMAGAGGSRRPGRIELDVGSIDEKPIQSDQNEVGKDAKNRPQQNLDGFHRSVRCQKRCQRSSGKLQNNPHPPNNHSKSVLYAVAMEGDIFCPNESECHCLAGTHCLSATSPLGLRRGLDFNQLEAGIIPRHVGAGFTPAFKFKKRICFGDWTRA